MGDVWRVIGDGWRDKPETCEAKQARMGNLKPDIKQIHYQ